MGVNEDIDLVLAKELAEKGDAVAQTSIGFMYANGQGVERDEKEAVKWYSKAAEQDHTPAQFFLGFMYVKGRGVEKDDREASRWYRKAAELWRFSQNTTTGHWSTPTDSGWRLPLQNPVLPPLPSPDVNNL